MVLPPGTLLQHLYLGERLRRIPAGRFIEVGVGTGDISRLLMRHGWRGIGYELNPASADIARARNVGHGYDVKVMDWLTAPLDEPADLVISSMVLEHLPDAQEAEYLRRARMVSGRIILIVPASPRHWGIEDDIAGHLRRYTRTTLTDRLQTYGWDIDHIAGLTYPLSNLLLPISNRLVGRAERGNLRLPASRRTVLSGNRSVPGKTVFPTIAKVLLNPVVIYPWHVMQKTLSWVDGALVLYVEARRHGSDDQN